VANQGEGRTSRRFAAGAASATLLASILLAAVLPATAANAGLTNATHAVQPAAQAPAGAHAIGAVSGSAGQSGLLVLRPRDNAALTRFIASVTAPHSPGFRHYLAAHTFASRFGPTSSTISAVRSRLQADGLTVTGVSSNGLLVGFRASASRVESAFQTRIERYRLADGRIAQATTTTVHVPASLGSRVAAVIGLNTLAEEHPLLVPHGARGLAGHRAASAPHFTHPTGSPTPCADATDAAVADGGLTDDQIANSYGAFGLYSAGDLAIASTSGSTSRSRSPRLTFRRSISASSATPRRPRWPAG